MAVVPIWGREFLIVSAPSAGKCQTLLDALWEAPAEADFVTVWNGDGDEERLNFGNFRHWAQAQAVQLRKHGARCEDRIILIMPQGTPLMTTFAGAMMLGAIPAILAYPNFKVEPVKYRTGLAGVSANLQARLIVIDDSFPEELLQHVNVGRDTQIVRGLDSLPAGTESDCERPDLRPEQVAFIQHSAGTTGLQKGVALSHAAVLRHIQRLAPALRLSPTDRFYSWLPLYHDMGLIACFMLPMVCHLPLVMQSPMDWVLHPGTMLRLMCQYRCTLAWLPNFAFQFLARRVPEEERTGLDLSRIRQLINCSEPVRASSMDEFIRAYASHGLRPETVQSCYAMAETVFAVTTSGTGRSVTPKRVCIHAATFRTEHRAVPWERTEAEGIWFVSSGRCLEGSEVRILSPANEELPEGGVGEILIRAESLFAGYYNRPDLTAKALRNGWYRSGDLGFVLDGELYVVGRKNDLIIVGGHNIYPQDVEEIATSHPLIHDGRAVALGVYNADLGTQDIVIVAEVEGQDDLLQAPQIEQEIRSEVVKALGIAVRAVYVKPPQWIVKSTAGKPARSTTLTKLTKEHPELAAQDAAAEWSMASGPAGHA
jgi:acyl-CoA synthetase (AMP-forming)/AMP-acid ligase II